MTATHTLTERYLAAAASRVPEAQRAELRRELAERIADTVDAKIAAGLPPADAEYRTLAELGDPQVLTAHYLDRPLHLIGPTSYPLWRQLVRLLVLIVAPLAAAGAAVGAALGRDPVHVVLGHGVLAGIQAAVWVTFWVTVVFAVLERRGAVERTRAGLAAEVGWKPERLPQVPVEGRRALRWEQIGSILGLTLLGVLVYLANDLPVFWADGRLRHVPIFVPETWAWLRWALLALIAAEVGLAIALLVRRRRSWAFVAASVVIAVATIAVTLPPLLGGELINPELFAATGWAWGARNFAAGSVGVTLLALLVVAGEAVDPVISAVTVWREQRTGVAR